MGRRPKSMVVDALRNAQLNWLEKLEQSTRETATAIARRAGLDPSTLTRFKKAGKGTLSTMTISQIASAWQVEAGADVRGGMEPPGLSEEAEPYKAPETASDIDTAIRALTAGRNNCDPWQLRSHSLEAIGYLPGDIVLVDLSATPRDGDAVLATVVDFELMKSVTVWRRYRQSGDLGVLVSASYDHDTGEPLLVNGKSVQVRGVLLPHRLRPVNKAA